MFLNTMTKDIINSKKLKCDYSPGAHSKFRDSLLEASVMKRTSQCKSYLRALFDVIYSKGINKENK